MAVVINGPVYPNAQAFADAITAAFPGEISHISTYEGHDPDRGGRPACLDVFPRSKDAGDRMAEWAKGYYRPYGIWYHIWYTRIWNPLVLLAWRAMTATGDVTADHKDHLHFTFFALVGFVRPPLDSPPEEDLTDEQNKMLTEVYRQIMDPKYGVGKALDDLNKKLIAIEDRLDKPLGK